MKNIMKMLSLLMAVILLAALGAPLCHADAPDSAKDASLTVIYKNGETIFSGLEIKIYRIAELNEHEEYSLTDSFNGYPVKVYGVKSQSEWRVIASTLSAYASADDISPSFKTVTDNDGKAVFADIPHGMYLVSAVRCETEDTYYSFEHFVAVVPRPTDDGGYDYDVEAIPKFDSSPKDDTEREMKIVKLWRDEGNEENRPDSIRVELLKNGQHFRSVILDESNNWSFTWTAPADNSVWEAVERDVPEGYTVSVIGDGDYIALTNSYDDGEVVPPQTGDDINLPLFALIFSLTGAILVLAAVKLRKREA